MDLNTYHIIKNYPNLSHPYLLNLINKSNIANSEPDLRALSQVVNTLASYVNFFTYRCGNGICIDFDPPNEEPDISVTAGVDYEIIGINIFWPLSQYGRTVPIPAQQQYFHNTDLTGIQNFLRNLIK